MIRFELHRLRQEIIYQGVLFFSRAYLRYGMGEPSDYFAFFASDITVRGQNELCARCGKPRSELCGADFLPMRSLSPDERFDLKRFTKTQYKPYAGHTPKTLAFEDDGCVITPEEIAATQAELDRIPAPPNCSDSALPGDRWGDL